MEAIFLPRVELSSKIESVAEAMRFEKVAGVIGENKEKLWLFDARAILRARREGVSILSGLELGASVHRLTLNDLKGLDQRVLVWPQRYSDAFQKVFERHSHHNYAAFGAVDRRVLLLTRFEQLKSELMLPDYYCTGPMQHSLPPAMRDKAGNCNLCGSPFESL